MTKNAPIAFVTPAGEELVVLPRAEYDALVAAASFDEDAADVALFDERMAALEGGGGTLPPDVSKHMLAGKRLIHALRLQSGLTQTQLAEKTGLTQGYISDLETGRRVGSEDALRKIADALAVPDRCLTAS